MSTDARGSFDALTRKCSEPLMVDLSVPRSLKQTHRAVSQRFASIAPDAASARQFPETQSRVEANRSPNFRVQSRLEAPTLPSSHHF